MRVNDEKKSRFLGLNFSSIFYTVISEIKAQLRIAKSKIPMELTAEKFIQAKEKELFPEDGRGSKRIEKLLFILRFHPDNYHRQHREIATEIEQQLGVSCLIAIGNHLKNVLKTIVAKHQKQMEADSLDTVAILNPNPGEYGAWKKVYQWLWKQEFPRWLTDCWWEKLQDKAEATGNWLQFNQPNFNSRDVVEPSLIPPHKQKIMANTPYHMEVNLPHTHRYLLLFNRGLITRYCLCPSQAFAPINKLPEEKIKLPQDGAMCPDIRFDEAGREEFLAILLEEKVNLPWLVTSEMNPLPELSGEKLQQLWESLQQQDYQFFYQNVEVV